MAISLVLWYFLCNFLLKPIFPCLFWVLVLEMGLTVKTWKILNDWAHLLEPYSLLVSKYTIDRYFFEKTIPRCEVRFLNLKKWRLCQSSSHTSPPQSTLLTLSPPTLVLSTKIDLSVWFPVSPNAIPPSLDPRPPKAWHLDPHPPPLIYISLVRKQICNSLIVLICG